jgi:hypothetical protein
LDTQEFFSQERHRGKQASPNQTEQQRDAYVRKAVEPAKSGFYSYQREEE